MHCKNCGKEIEEGAYVCKHCGVATNIDYSKYNVEPNDNIGCFPMVISFVIPIVGFILYFAWKSNRPKSAKTAAKCAWTRIIINIIIGAIGLISDHLY